MGNTVADTGRIAIMADIAAKNIRGCIMSAFV